MISEEAGLLEDEVRLYWEISSAAAMSSRGADTKRAREDVEDLHMHAVYGTTARLRASAERTIRAIAASPLSVRSARRAAKIALAELASPTGDGMAFLKTGSSGQKRSDDLI
jgi:hypothetical protein